MNTIEELDALKAKDRQNFNACFKRMKEAGHFFEKEIFLEDEDLPDQDVLCAKLSRNSDNNLTLKFSKVILYKTKLGIFRVYDVCSDADDVEFKHYSDSDFVWHGYLSMLTQDEYVDEAGEFQYTLLLKFLREKMPMYKPHGIVYGHDIEFLIGNYLPEPGSIAPIKNIIHHVDEWLAKK